MEGSVGLYDYPLRGPPLRSSNARYYSPVLARFISADTIVPDPANPQALNRYAYVLNNPLRYTDPSGHIVETVWDIISIGLSIEEVARNPSDPLNWAGLAVDVGATFLPGVPGGVGAVRKATKLAGEVASHADEITTANRVRSRTDDLVANELPHSGRYARVLPRGIAERIEAGDLNQTLAKP